MVLVGILLARERFVIEHGCLVIGEVAEQDATVVIDPAKETASEGKHPVALPEYRELALALAVRLWSKHLFDRPFPFAGGEDAERCDHLRRLEVVVLVATRSFPGHDEVGHHVVVVLVAAAAQDPDVGVHQHELVPAGQALRHLCTSWKPPQQGPRRGTDRVDKDVGAFAGLVAKSDAEEDVVLVGGQDERIGGRMEEHGLRHTVRPMEVEVGDQRRSPQGEGQVAGLAAGCMDCDGRGVISNGRSGGVGVVVAVGAADSVQKHPAGEENGLLRIRRAGE